ncbi:MAG: molybdopterin molybdotransferase MoeA [Chthonomonadaceae bacterium]|nr:molybdopterin molybdotransferase MoeA [Chthonomonadaceae bacterium]
MVSFGEALETVKQRVGPINQASVDILKAIGLVLAKDVLATQDSPPFDNSAVDGFAVPLSQIGKDFRAPVAGSIGAGESRAPRVSDDEILKIFTGAPVPKGVGAVVMQEDVAAVDGVADVPATSHGANIRRAGSEFKSGDLLVHSGSLVTPGILSCLASQGLESVDVALPKKVGLLVSGDELKNAGETLQHGEIYESNSVGLVASISLLGGKADCRKVPDDPAKICSEFCSLEDSCDVILTVGGASVGQFDYVRQTVLDNGYEFAITKVAMKPGKPFFMAIKDEKTVFGLPGNPLSAAMTFSLFVYPYLAASSGRPFDRSVQVVCEEIIQNIGDRDNLVAADVRAKQGRLFARVAAQSSSGSVRGLAGKNAALFVPANGEVRPGSLGTAYWLPWSGL